MRHDKTYDVAEDKHGITERVVPRPLEALGRRHRPVLTAHIRLGGDHSEPETRHIVKHAEQFVYDDLYRRIAERFVVVAGDGRARQVSTSRQNGIEHSGAVAGDGFGKSDSRLRPAGWSDQKAQEVHCCGVRY